MMVVKSSLTFIFLILLSISALAEPKVEIPEHEFNFGKTLQRMKIAHTFWIKSVGDDTLRITEIEPGCSCTEIPLTDSVIAPGDSIQFSVIFSTGSYRGSTLKKPHIITNAGKDPVYMKIYADVYKDPGQMLPLRLSPPAVDLSVYTYDNMHEKATFNITNTSDRDYTLKLVDVTNKPVTVELPGKIKAGDTVEGVVNLRKEVLNMDFLDSFTFEINDDFHTHYTVPIRRIMPPINPDSIKTDDGKSR